LRITDGGRKEEAGRREVRDHRRHPFGFAQGRLGDGKHRKWIATDTFCLRSLISLANL
jgi:hypothetical protein